MKLVLICLALALLSGCNVDVNGYNSRHNADDLAGMAFCRLGPDHYAVMTAADCRRHNGVIVK